MDRYDEKKTHNKIEKKIKINPTQICSYVLKPLFLGTSTPDEHICRNFASAPPLSTHQRHKSHIKGSIKSMGPLTSNPRNARMRPRANNHIYNAY